MILEKSLVLYLMPWVQSIVETGPEANHVHVIYAMLFSQLITGLLAYLIGSIPFGLLLTRAAGTQDIRSIGSGNIGATNVLRTGNKTLAALTLLLDMAKGYAAVWLAVGLGTGYIVPGICAVLGHSFPLWLRFRGGKGVATAIGVLLAVNLSLAGAVMLTWLGVFALSRISSLSAILALLLSPLYALLLLPKLGGQYIDYFSIGFVALLAVIVIARHRDNIVRLYKREEPRFGQFK